MFCYPHLKIINTFLYMYTKASTIVSKIHATITKKTKIIKRIYTTSPNIY